MGKVYRNKKGSGCKMCKPWKHSWAPKFKLKELLDRRDAEKVSQEYIQRFNSHTKGIGLPK
jgi:hypothetical protein